MRGQEPARRHQSTIIKRQTAFPPRINQVHNILNVTVVIVGDTRHRVIYDKEILTSSNR